MPTTLTPNERQRDGETDATGRIIVQFELMNYSDLLAVEESRLTPDKVRKVAMRGVVDTGATRLVIPKGVVELLGLPLIGYSTVRYADQRMTEREMVKDAYVQLMGRGGSFKAVVEPDRSDALLGAIVMEDLDFTIDCAGHRLVPRDPNTIISELE